MIEQATSCSVLKPIPVRDSTVINYHFIDSINWIDSTVLVPIYKEYYRDYTDMLDTLNLETSLAAAKAYLDTTNKKLAGEIKNKDTSIPYQIKWKEKIVYRDSLVYKEKEIPVPYEMPVKFVPKFYKFCLIWFIVSVLGLAAFIYIKFFL